MSSDSESSGEEHSRMESSVLKDLINKRGVEKRKLTLFKKYLLRLDPLAMKAENFLDLELRVVKISSVLEQFEKIQDQIETLSSEVEKELEERETFENSYYENVAKAKEYLKGLVSTSSNPPESTQPQTLILQPTDSIKYPDISLPSFSGNLTDWIEFRDTFDALVNQSKLKSIQKLKYLKGCLKDGAQEVISSLEYSEESYSIAWKLLCERFNNPRVLVFNHLRALFYIDVVPTNAKALRGLADNISKHLRTLRLLNVSTEGWDLLVIFFLAAKLEPTLQRKWEEKINNRELPTLQDFKTFLRTRADLQETLSHSESVGASEQRSSRKALVTTTSPDLHSRPPLPKAQWTDIRDATNEGAVCPQPEGSYVKSQMSEDCLFVNVYVPANKTRPLSVLAFIHGGEFNSGSGNADVKYGPQLLLQKDIIVVTFNYRLGALGFLSLETEEASGNAGLKDMVLALKWINKNIDRFGGHRNKITVGGQSAGSVAAHYLLLTEKTRGLFKQAILITGSALGYRFLARHAKQNALALKKQLGISDQDTHQILQKLKAVDAFEIVQAQADMGDNDTRKGFRPFAPFVPCVEIQTDDAFITQEPRDIIKAGIPQNVPILAGFNTDEGLKMYPVIQKNYTLLQYLNDDFERCIPSDIEYPYKSKESQDLARRIREFYFQGQDISNCTIKSFVDLVTDTMFSYSIDNWIKIHKERKNSNSLFYYNLAFDNVLNWFKITNKVDRPGTAHTDELGYSFVTEVTKQKLYNLEPEAQNMVSMWTTILTNFVKYGSPTLPQADGKAVWPESGPLRNHVLITNEDLQKRLEAPRLYFHTFWQNVYDEYYEYVNNGGELGFKVVP